MNQNVKVENATIIDSFNKTVHYFSISRIKGFLNQISGREKEIKLIKENYYISLDFTNGHNIETILKQNMSIVIGNPGSGKTQLLVNIFLKIKNNLNKTLGFYYRNEFLPFFIPLRNLGSNENLEAYLWKKKQEFNLNGEQKFILILDGLDEISLEKMNEILNFIDNNQDNKYIISSRKTSTNLGFLLSKHPEFEEFEIKEFDFNIDAGGNTSILEKYFKEKGKKIDLENYKKFQIEIKDIFYLEQFFEIYEDLNEKDGKLELTEKFIKKILNKNNELLSFETNEKEIFILLTKLSEFLYKNNTLTLEKEDLEKNIKNISIKKDKEKHFIDYILKTFFIKSNLEYSFYHKTFYEYFLVRYIMDEYHKNKLSIREGNILSDSEFIVKIFFPYLQKTYLDNEDYSRIIGLNFFMTYYLGHNPINEINSEIFIRSLFDLPEELLRYYIFEKTSPIYRWFEGFYYLNYSTIKIALDKGYNDIANTFYKKLNSLIRKKYIEEKKIIGTLGRLNKEDEDFQKKEYELKEKRRFLFNGLDYKKLAYIKNIFKKLDYCEIYKLIGKKPHIYENIEFTSNFYENHCYAFFDDLIKYGNESDNFDILKQLNKTEFYAFLQVGLKLENIKNILSNRNILNLIKEKFKHHKGDFKELINYNKEDLKIKDNSITLFLKYIFGLYDDQKEIFDSQDFHELKEGSNGFFNIHWGFYKSNLNNSQLASYLFYNQVDLKETVEKEYILSKAETGKKIMHRYVLGYYKRCIYQYSYSIFIDSILENKKINFKKYIEIIKNYSSIRLMDNLYIKEIYSEILAYIFYYNVEGDYLDNISSIWGNLEEFVDKINFYKTLQRIDQLNGTNKLKEILDITKIDELKKYIIKTFDYPASEVEKHIFISQLYGLNGNKDLQIKSFDRGIANSYVKYGFRKDYYLTFIFEILEELKHCSIITEKKTFKYLDEIIELYGEIDGITEKGVAYLGKNIIRFIANFSIEKAEEYKDKINYINNSYSDEIGTTILVQKIKNNSFKKEDIEYIYLYDDEYDLLKLKIYLYLIDIGKEEFINEANECLSKIGTSYIRYYWQEEDLKLYEKIYKLGKINESEVILNELKKSKKETEETLSLNSLSDNKVIEVLNSKYCGGMYLSGDYNYLLIDLYNKNKNLFYKYIGGTKFKYIEENKYVFFTNIKGLTKVYIENNEKTKAIELFDELLSFAELLIK